MKVYELKEKTGNVRVGRKSNKVIANAHTYKNTGRNEEDK